MDILNDKKTNNKDTFLKKSFVITYILLLTTGTITFIEAMRTNDDKIRHILNLETCISIVAGYFYYKFVNYIENNNNIDITFWNNINEIRYLDWSITTPMMLLVLSLILSSNNNETLNYKIILAVIILNYIMLYIGYLGEIKKMNKFNAYIISFIAFILMFGILYKEYIENTNSKSNKIFFSIFVFVWSIYGFIYYFPIILKNTIFNILDLISKCLVGLLIWLYYTNIITI
jgi:bacteriorhodopsin